MSVRVGALLMLAVAAAFIISLLVPWTVLNGLIDEQPELATAILIGDRTGLDADDERRLQEAGTYHVIAISGGNIAILTAILLILFRTVRTPPRFAAALTIGLLLFYGSLTAPAASVDRAVTAACVYLAGRLLDQSGAALNVLAVAAALAIALVPVTAFDPGFVLSFVLATLFRWFGND